MRLFVFALVSTVGVLCAGELSNRRAPGFSLPDSQLRQWDIQDLRGKVVILDIMKTACPSCQKLALTLERVRAKYGNRIQILSIVNPPDNQATVAQFIATYKVQSPILFDCGQVAASYFKATPSNPSIHVPHLFLIDGNGMIRNDFAYEDKTKAIFEGDGLFAEIDKLLAPAPAAKK